MIFCDVTLLNHRMFVMENGNKTSQPCFVGQSITWQTRSDSQFLESHQATEKLNINQTECNRLSPYSNDVHFQLIDPLEYETWSRNISCIRAAQCFDVIASVRY